MLTAEHITTKLKLVGEEDTGWLIGNQNGCEKGDPVPGSICSEIASEAGTGNRSKPADSSSSELNQYLFRVILHQCVVSLASFIATLDSSCQLQSESNIKAIAVGRCFNSGMLTATSMIEISRLRDELDMAFLGGPVLGSKCGRIAGMTCHGGKMAVLLPLDKIIECLKRLGIMTGSIKGGNGTKTPKFPINRNFYGPSPRRGGFSELIWCKSFEEKFEGDIWSELSKELPSALSECVVALASFDEDGMHFACTGIFIDRYPARILTSASLVRNYHNKSKIDDNLKIEVCLQNKSRVIATLKHYDLCYNVAVVEMICFRSPYAIELKKAIRLTSGIDVVAVGCCFKGCKLMATKGVLVDGLSKLDCRALGVSTCKITKAGIGGPLIDNCRNFIGMNFYDKEETPFLPREQIQEVLRQFDSEEHNAAKTIDRGDPYRWPVPDPARY
ncbi:uncharacterized protein LOC102717244 isoform X2 [Oryza brachyantha]|uniref:uncharacterized protein LOC102717244 isoform X2 n=1 Tax=Oryza brachyantha TaxID=4533 RepID=UPI0007765945|nr:uncharacterized protein LOC102717244 isoform X2 [Oryza brachyantha]